MDRLHNLGLIALSALWLSACTDSYSGDTYDEVSAPPVAAMMETSQSFSAKSAPQGGASSQGPVSPDTNPSAQSFLAYRYGYSFRLKAASVKPTMNAHMQRCMDAGPALCQVLGSSSQAYDDDNASASLSLRAEPKWLDGYVEDIQKSVADASGEMINSDVSVQDLTRQILDTDARLKAQTTLRDRLQNLLETRDGKLPDLLAVERELARVQGEIESATSVLAALRKRVSMSAVNINYQSQSVAVSRSAFAPVADALTDFFRLMAEALAGIIRFLAVALPILILLILPGLWALRWLWRRRRT